MKERTLKVSAICEGTVIDHIEPGKAFTVARILGLPRYESTVTIALNVESGKSAKKDIIKIENRMLSEKELNKISLISPQATINIIKGFTVKEKRVVSVPEDIEGIVSCSNPNCISRKESVPSLFHCESEKPLRVRCHFCDRIMTEEEVGERI
jgi:aspartate carbamoyltransferase regulatory subunit